MDDTDVEVDPRIAARRQSVEQERRRRRRRRLLAAAVVVGVVAGAWLITRTGLFDVDRLRVDGATHESTDDIITASGLRPGDQLLDIDSGRVAAVAHEDQRHSDARDLVLDDGVGEALLYCLNTQKMALRPRSKSQHSSGRGQLAYRELAGCLTTNLARPSRPSKPRGCACARSTGYRAEAGAVRSEAANSRTVRGMTGYRYR